MPQVVLSFIYINKSWRSTQRFFKMIRRQLLWHENPRSSFSDHIPALCVCVVLILVSSNDVAIISILSQTRRPVDFPQPLDTNWYCFPLKRFAKICAKISIHLFQYLQFSTYPTMAWKNRDAYKKVDHQNLSAHGWSYLGLSNRTSNST